jgi:regulatory protein
LPDETPDDVAAAIDRVQSLGYLNEQRAAESFARVSSKKYGRARVQADLQRRGLDRDTIATVLPSPEDDLQTARLAWAKKFKAAPSNALERAKQARYLANKGFSSAIITSVLRASSPAPNPNATEDPDAFAFDPD